MEGLRSDSLACRYVASQLAGVPFTIVDVGCSGGIGPIWRLFGKKLLAYGFDPDLDECKRLSAEEPLTGVHYIPAFVGLPPNHPIAVRRGGNPYLQRNPWDRLAVARSLAVRDRLKPAMSNAELTALNQWHRTTLADPNKSVYLPDFFRDRAIADIDLIKIDVDGPDFDILQTLADSLIELNVLAVGLEVNFFGSDDGTGHTFHNTDSLMRGLGFALAHLTMRPYSLAALPMKYRLPRPAESVSGRPYQGDALYVRDWGDPAEAARQNLSPAKMAKLASIFAAFGLYDSAAEVVLTHRERLADFLDPIRLLDLLCVEAQGDEEPKLSYVDYMAAFERDDDRFYPPAAKTSSADDNAAVAHDALPAVEQDVPPVSPSHEIQSTSEAEGVLRSLYRRFRKR
jgi:Methyltransferase FkbM domain